MPIESILSNANSHGLALSEIDLSERGRESFEWARSHMPVLTLAGEHIRKKMGRKNVLHGLRLAACLHVSKETSVLVNLLNSFGMKTRLVAANPLSSQDGIAAFLKGEKIDVRAQRGESVKQYESEILEAAKSKPDIIVDDGGELHVAYAQTKIDSCIGGTDETTSGTVRLRALDAQGKLRYPAIPVNESRMKHLFDNRYGSGQSAIDGLIRATNLLLAGKIVVVLGYGWVGRGVAERSRGLGARVIVTEVDPTKALEALFEGFEVLTISEAAKIGDIFLTCTGQVHVISSMHFKNMKDGAILGNVGHFDQEIDVQSLRKLGRVERVGPNIEKLEFKFSGMRKKLFLLCQGRVINLVSAEGHPPEVMQLSFANQLLSIYYLVANRNELAQREKKVIAFPDEINSLVSSLALEGFNLKIDSLNERQKKYGASFIR